MDAALRQTVVVNRVRMPRPGHGSVRMVHLKGDHIVSEENGTFFLDQIASRRQRHAGTRAAIHIRPDLAAAKEHTVLLTELHALPGSAALNVLRRDAVVRIHVLQTLVAGDVEQHAAQNDRRDGGCIGF